MRAIAILISIFQGACVTGRCAEPAHRNDRICAVANDIVNCTTENARVLIDQFAPVVSQLVAKATGDDGTVNWPSIMPLLQQFGVADGGCVLASVVAQLQGRSSAEVGPGKPSHASISQGFDLTRSLLWPATRFHFESQDL